MKHILLVMICGLAAWIQAAAPELSMVADPLENYYSVTGKIPDRKTDLRFFIGEAGIAAFSLYNPTNATMYCRVGLTGLEALQPQLREAIHIRARRGQLPADVLPEISADGVVVIPAGENRQIFIDLKTRGVKPGKYQGSFTAVNLAGEAAVNGPLNVEILPLSLPEKHPLSIMTWDCSLRRTTGAARTKIRNMLMESYVNAFHVLERPALKNGKYDFTAMNSLLAELKGEGLIMLRCAAPAQEMNIQEEQGAAEYITYIRAIVQNMKAQGFGYDDFVLYPYDENVQDIFYAAARLSKEADPKVMVYADPTAKATPEEMKRLFDGKYVDYFQYNASFFNDRGDLIRPFMNSVKYNSIYWCPVIQKRLRPNSFHRQMGRVAYREKLQGIGYWTSLWMPGSDRWGLPWDDFRGKTASAVTIYPGRSNDSESIPSRRWRAFRVGLEDYLIFDQVRRKGNSRLEKKIDNAVQFSRSASESEQLRNEIVNFLLEK